MTNENIKYRMIKLVDDYEAGYITPIQVESGMETLVNALERIPYSIIGEMRTQCFNLVVSDMNIGDEYFIDIICVSDAISSIRMLIGRIPD